MKGDIGVKIDLFRNPLRHSGVRRNDEIREQVKYRHRRPRVRAEYQTTFVAYRIFLSFLIELS